jgi:hypothetical protein
MGPSVSDVSLTSRKDGGVDRGDLLQMKVAHGGTFASIKVIIGSSVIITWKH